jgi:hypothetical protein
VMTSGMSTGETTSSISATKMRLDTVRSHFSARSGSVGVRYDGLSAAFRLHRLQQADLEVQLVNQSPSQLIDVGDQFGIGRDSDMERVEIAE